MCGEEKREWMTCQLLGEGKKMCSMCIVLHLLTLSSDLNVSDLLLATFEVVGKLSCLLQHHIIASVGSWLKISRVSNTIFLTCLYHGKGTPSIGGQIQLEITRVSMIYQTQQILRFSDLKPAYRFCKSSPASTHVVNLFI